MRETIYLDNAATTLKKPESVYQEMDKINRSLAVNAGRGSYALAREAVGIMDKLRLELLNIVNANQVAEAVITPSATVALNQIIGGMEITDNDVVYVSPFEHNAIMRTLHIRHQEAGFEILELPLKENETDKQKMPEIDVVQMEYLFAKKAPAYVFLSHVSNVTGYILPVEEISAAAKEYGAKIIIDASQSIGLVPIDFAKWQTDYLVFAGHKTLYGPLGIGGFIIRHGNVLKPYFAGGTGSDSLNPNMPVNAPQAYEAASPNIVAAGGLLAALKEIKEIGTAELFALEKQLTKQLIEGLESIPAVRLYLPSEASHTGIVAFNIAGYIAADVGMILDEDYGIAVRTGYHCAPLIHKYLNEEGHLGVVRASVSRFTTKEDVEALLSAVREM